MKTSSYAMVCIVFEVFYRGDAART